MISGRKYSLSYIYTITGDFGPITTKADTVMMIDKIVKSKYYNAFCLASNQGPSPNTFHLLQQNYFLTFFYNSYVCKWASVHSNPNSFYLNDYPICLAQLLNKMGCCIIQHVAYHGVLIKINLNDLQLLIYQWGHRKKINKTFQVTFG